MLYGVTSHGPRKSSYAAPTVNVAISRAVDLFLLVVDRECYGYNAQEVFFGSDDAKSYGFHRLLGSWLRVNEFVGFMDQVAGTDDQEGKRAVVEQLNAKVEELGDSVRHTLQDIDRATFTGGCVPRPQGEGRTPRKHMASTWRR